jgi:hypothetical protein
MRYLFVIAAALVLSGCNASREKTLELEAGMTPAQVQQMLGQPDSKRVRNGDNCLMYSMWRDFWNRRPGDYSDRYFACFKSGKLDTFGRVGDQF